LKVYEYIIRRLALMIFVLFGVSAIVFYLARGFPSAFAPWSQYITVKMRPGQIDEIIKAHGFDQPLYIQYWYWLRDVFHGDWGYSNWANGLPTYRVFASRFPFTVELTVAATVLTLAIGIPLGIMSALKNNTMADHAARLIALTGYSVPSYWFAYILQLVFAFYFYRWGLPNLPSGDVISQGLTGAVPTVTGLPILDGLIAGNLTYTSDALAHLILPAFNLSFISLGYLARIVRASMLEVLRQDYIIMARSKGLSERIVVYRHALRNALIPAMTLTGLFVAGLLGGAIITETVFSWPGVGNVSLRAVFQGDSNFLLLYSLVTALIIVVANLAVDVTYVLLDPRIRY
jgi:ABC-type dipeptide/oligopeptide/nickel transport system permease component